MADALDDEHAALARRLVDARPEGDPVARAVWRARVQAALFGDTEPVMIGRYQLQRPLGRGGGGSVYVASDPELHREVAVKLIRCASPRHRERALAEGRALARLSHANVVPVHDVGETDGHVYLVMELLRGRSLRERAARCTLRELVDGYREAAAGLAAAHAVGLVHRDFKPDNAVFGDDGRLRVVDFGLASAAAAGAPAGTPRYMAPEQRAAGTQAGNEAGKQAEDQAEDQAENQAENELGPAVDQFALGVALREALAQRGRGEPAWLARAIDRATAPRPEQRYPSMTALAAALARDPRRRWQRVALVAMPLALAALGFWAGQGRSDAPEPCAGGPDALAPVWTPARAAAAAERVAGLATPFAQATAPRVRDRLDALGRAWLTAQRQSCLAHERGELSDELYDRATVCLARARIGLGQAMELVLAAPGDRLEPAVAALSEVALAARCADPVALAAEANPPRTPAARALDQQVEVAAIQARAATPRAVALAQGAASAARAAGDRAVLARTLLVLGHAYMSDLATLREAIAPLHEALMLAVDRGLDDIAVEAFARHAYAYAQFHADDRLGALDGLELIRAIGGRAGPRGAFGRALLSNNVAAVAALAGDFDRARSELRRSLADGEAVHGPGSVELQTTISNLAMLSGDRAERARLFAAAVDQVSAAVGADAPMALSRRFQAISDRDAPREVLGELPALCRRIGQLHSHLTGLDVRCWFELAWQAAATGDAALVREAARSLPPAAAGLEAQLIAGYAAVADGAPPATLAAELAALARTQADRVATDGWYKHLSAADAELALAAVARAQGDARRASDAAARATEHLARFAAATGVSAGIALRRQAWARELVAGTGPGAGPRH